MNRTLAPPEDALAFCRHCGRIIVWQHDRNDDADIIPGVGFWYDAERMTEVCPSNDPENPDGGWHSPSNRGRTWPAEVAVALHRLHYLLNVRRWGPCTLNPEDVRIVLAALDSLRGPEDGS